MFFLPKREINSRETKKKEESISRFFSSSSPLALNLPPKFFPRPLFFYPSKNFTSRSKKGCPLAKVSQQR